MNARNDNAIEALRKYFRKEADRNDLYFNSSTDFVDGRVDLAEIVRVVRAALAAPAPASARSEEK